MMVIALFVGACSAEATMSDPTTAAHVTASRTGALPPPTIEEAIGRATVVVEGEVIRTDTNVTRVRVDDVLRGDVAVGSVIDVVGSVGALTQGDFGVWAIDDSDPATLLLGGLKDQIGRQVARLVAGLPRMDRLLGPADIRNLAQDSDAVVLAQVASSDGATGEARVLDTYSGTVPAQFAVTIAEQPEQPGGPWRFDTGEDTKGVLFLVQGRDGWIAINPTDPRSMQPSYVEGALRGTP